MLLITYLTNINTPGYTKQRLDLASLNTQKGDFLMYTQGHTVKHTLRVGGLRPAKYKFRDIRYKFYPTSRLVLVSK